eukprot:s3308_g5.t2
MDEAANQQMWIAMQDLMQVALVVACVFAGWSLQTSACSFLLQRMTYPLKKTVDFTTDHDASDSTEEDSGCCSDCREVNGWISNQSEDPSTRLLSSSKTRTFLGVLRSLSNMAPLVQHQVRGRAGLRTRPRLEDGRASRRFDLSLKTSPYSLLPPRWPVFDCCHVASAGLRRLMSAACPSISSCTRLRHNLRTDIHIHDLPAIAFR